MCRAGNGAAAATDPAQSRRQAGNEYACDCRRSSEYFRSEEKLSGSPAHLRLIFSSYLSEGLRPSDSPTRSLARRFDGSLRSRGLASLRSLAPASDPLRSRWARVAALARACLRPPPVAGARVAALARACLRPAPLKLHAEKSVHTQVQLPTDAGVDAEREVISHSSPHAAAGREGPFG